MTFKIVTYGSSYRLEAESSEPIIVSQMQVQLMIMSGQADAWLGRTIFGLLGTVLARNAGIDLDTIIARYKAARKAAREAEQKVVQGESIDNKFKSIITQIMGKEEV